MKIFTQIRTILADTKTPIGLYLALRDKYLKPILLESSDYNSKEGHFSYLCFEPIGSFSLNEGTIRTKIEKEIKEEKIKFEANVLIEKLNEFKNKFNTEKQEVNYCYAGLFGYTGFEIIKYSENEILITNKREVEIPELLYHFYSLILVFNHQTNSLHIVSHALSEETALVQIQTMRNEIQSSQINSFPFQIVSDEETSLTDNEFESLVTKAKYHCQIGDVFQLVLSRRFKISFTGDEFNVYRALKNINPSPYLFYFDMGDFRLFGSSPEAQLLIKNNIAEIHPIAGTYKRTANDNEDLEKANQLKKDEKENSEHVMLVDLARNDLSKYCKEVEVKEFKKIQFYSHVTHLVSKVIGRVKEKLNAFELLFGTFPAGTLSGAPKYKALQLINKYEPIAREFYGGCAGFIDLNGNINHAIMIRTFLSKNNTLYYQAGAGIVVSSVEKNELNEINNKIGALRKAIVNTGNFNNIAKANISKKKLSVSKLETAQ